MHNPHCLAISGGVGGAKLALGLSHVIPQGDLTIVANTGDDFTHLGMKICPDLDTVMYTLSELANKELGWGQAGETWQFLEALSRLGGEDWFRLGDRDLATHILRTEWLAAGATLSEVTDRLCRQLAIAHKVVPMSDQNVATRVHTKTGEVLSFQHYFVRDKCAPEVTSFEFEGIAQAQPAPGFSQALAHQQLGCVLVCPSNPFVSVDPVLKIPGVTEQLLRSGAPVVAVSPIVGGLAIKGPAAKMMAELGMPQTALAVAEHYASAYKGLVRGFVIDEVDADMTDAIRKLGMQVLVTQTIMKSLEDRIVLARETLDFSLRI